MSGADARVCRNTRVRLWGRLEACGVGGTTSKGRCEGLLWGGAEGGARCGVGGVVMWL
jgi:hypothetical protein